MAELKDITEHTTGLCAATLAYATATATTVGTVAALGPIAVPVLTLAAIGLSAWHSKKLHCVDRAMKSVLADMRKSGTIAPAMIDRTLLILREAPPASITAAELAEAAKTTDVHSAVATLLLSRFPKANDDPEARALIETALASGIRALRSDPQFHLEFTQEVLIDLASAQGIQLQHLRAIQVNTDQIPEILRRLGGIENILANPEALSLKDLTDLAARFGEHSATTRESLILFLTNKAEEYRTYRAQIEALDDRVAAIANLKGAAQDAADRLDFEEVEALLSRVQEVELDIAAQTAEARAANALLRGRPEQAYILLSATADSFGAIDPLEPARRRIYRSFETLWRHGLRYGGPGITLSEKMIRAALSDDLRAQQSTLWAAGQVCLAVALFGQARRTEGEAGATLLAEAVAAYRAALQVTARAEHPLDWAGTQNNLAIALRDQANRTEGAAGAALLAEAVAAFRAALQVTARAEHPLDWAGTQNNLATALGEQANRSEGAAGAGLLAEAVAAYRAALTVRTRAEHPVDWAMTQENLANAERDIARHPTTPDPAAHLAAALAHVVAALTVFDPIHMSYNQTKATRLRDEILAAQRTRNP